MMLRTSAGVAGAATGPRPATMPSMKFSRWSGRASAASERSLASSSVANSAEYVMTSTSFFIVSGVGLRYALEEDLQPLGRAVAGAEQGRRSRKLPGPMVIRCETRSGCRAANGQGDHPAHRVADQRGLLDAERVHQLDDGRRRGRRRPTGAASDLPQPGASEAIDPEAAPQRPDVGAEVAPARRAGAAAVEQEHAGGRSPASL